MKTVVVTGSTRGIGRGMAEHFLRRDCRVVVSGRSQAALAVVLTELEDRFGADCIAGVVCDITDYSSVQALWDFACVRFETVDVWINNAGMAIAHKPVHLAAADDLRRIVDTNLTGMLFANKVAMAGMAKQGWGQIWNMEGFGSNGAVRPGLVPYGATKRAVNYLNKALRCDAEGTGVHICTLSPGMVVTDLLIGDYDIRSAEWQRVKRVFNILADTVDTVAPWLVEGILASDRDGARVRWLTTPKVVARFLLAPFRRRDLFADSVC